MTGRQLSIVDHEMMIEFGEAMAIYKPILNHKPFRSNRPEEKVKKLY